MWCLKRVHVLCECSESTYGFFYSRDICCLEFIVETNQVWQLMTMLRQILHSIHHTVIIRNEIRIRIDQKNSKNGKWNLSISLCCCCIVRMKKSLSSCRYHWKKYVHSIPKEMNEWKQAILLPMTTIIKLVHLFIHPFIQCTTTWIGKLQENWKNLLAWGLFSGCLNTT